MKRSAILVGVVLVVILAFGGYVLLSNRDNGTTNTSEQSNTGEKESQLDEGSIEEGDTTETTEALRLIIGDKTAPLTITEYGDYQCPNCERFFRDTEPQIREAYIDSGQVNIDFRPEVHIGEGSIIAAQGAFCAADQGQFEAYHEAVFTKRGSGELNAISKSAINDVAAEINLNQDTFSDCMANDMYRDEVLASHNEARQDVGITQTPTFLIGQRRISGAQPFNIFKPIIDAELSRSN